MMETLFELEELYNEIYGSLHLKLDKSQLRDWCNTELTPYLERVPSNIWRNREMVISAVSDMKEHNEVIPEQVIRLIALLQNKKILSKYDNRKQEFNWDFFVNTEGLDLERKYLEYAEKFKAKFPYSAPMSMLQPLRLDQREIGFIGTLSFVLESETTLRRGAGVQCFDHMTYSCEFESVYKRYVSLPEPIVEQKVNRDIVHKYTAGKGSFAHYVSHKAIFKFIWDTESIWVYSEALKRVLREYITIHRDDHTLTIRSRNPSKYLLEFKFKSNDIGPVISVITRKENIDKKWCMAKYFSEMLYSSDDKGFFISEHGPDQEFIEFSKERGIEVTYFNGKYYFD